MIVLFILGNLCLEVFGKEGSNNYKFKRDLSPFLKEKEVNVSLQDVFPNANLMNFKLENENCKITQEKMQFPEIMGIPEIEGSNYKVSAYSNYLYFLGNSKLIVFTIEMRIKAIVSSFKFDVEGYENITYFSVMGNDVVIEAQGKTTLHKLGQKINPSISNHFTRNFEKVSEIECESPKSLLFFGEESHFLNCRNDKIVSLKNLSSTFSFPQPFLKAETCEDSLLLLYRDSLEISQLTDLTKRGKLLEHGIMNPEFLYFQGRAIVIANKTTIGEFHIVTNCSDINFFRYHTFGTNHIVQHLRINQELLLVITEDNQILYKKLFEEQGKDSFSSLSRRVEMEDWLTYNIRDGFNSFGIVGKEKNSTFSYIHFRESEQFLHCKFLFEPHEKFVITGESIFCSNKLEKRDIYDEGIIVKDQLEYRKGKPLIYDPKNKCLFLSEITIENMQSAFSSSQWTILFLFSLTILVTLYFVISRRKVKREKAEPQYIETINYEENSDEEVKI